MQRLEELEKRLLSDEVAVLDMATWASRLREYIDLREGTMTKEGFSADDAAHNRRLYETFSELKKVFAVNMEQPDLSKEADRLMAIAEDKTTSQEERERVAARLDVIQAKLKAEYDAERKMKRRKHAVI